MRFSRKTNPASVSRGFCSLFSLCSVLGVRGFPGCSPSWRSRQGTETGRQTRPQGGLRRVPRPRRHANHQPPAVFAGQVQPRLGESLIGAGGAVPGLAGLPLSTMPHSLPSAVVSFTKAKSRPSSRLFHSSSFHSSSPPACFSTLHSPAPRGWLRPLRFLARSIFGVFFPFGQEPTYDRPHYRTPYQGRR